MDYFRITKRCIRCRKPLRADGTCQNEKCVRYKPEPEQTQDKTETAANDGTASTSEGKEA